MPAPLVRDLDDVQRALDDLYAQGEGLRTGWIAMPYNTTNWLDYDTTGLWGPAAYRRDRDGMVHLRGLVRSVTAAPYAYAAASSVIATFPKGFRPGQDQMGLLLQADSVAAYSLNRLDLRASTGALLVQGPMVAGASNNGQVDYAWVLMKPWLAEN